MKTNHYVALGMLLTGLASQLSAMHTWGEVRSPAAVAGVLLNIGGILLALFSDKPRNGDS